MIIATAGHVDHGKTSLVRALTGVDTDRLPEEKLRGLTIDLGFAYTDAFGARVGFVDVPGHQRFLPNMLAGVAGIDAALLVVAADDGVMPQTREHLQILQLLGVAQGIVALTKCDRVTPARQAEVVGEIGTLCAGTAFATHAPLPIATPTGEGIDALRGRLGELIAANRPVAVQGLFRLAIDRVFSVTGAGTVVTGMVHSGRCTVGDELRIVPGGQIVRVRGIRGLDKPVDQVEHGTRAALNLSGVSRDDLTRGCWVVDKECGAPTARFILRLHQPADDTLFSHWTEVHAHAAASRTPARVALLDAAGGRSWLEVRTRTPLLAVHGDRCVIRDASATLTLGGGRVVETYPPRGPTRREPPFSRLQALLSSDRDASLTALLALPGAINAEQQRTAWNLSSIEFAQLVARTNARRVGTGASAMLVSSAVWSNGMDVVTKCVRAWHLANPQVRGPNMAQLGQLAAAKVAHALLSEVTEACIADDRLRQSGGYIHAPEFLPRLTGDDRALWQRMEKLLIENKRPPAVAELPTLLNVRRDVLVAVLGRLAHAGHIVAVANNRYFLPEHLSELATLAATLAAEDDTGQLTVRAFRDRSDLGRNLAVDVLEYFDHLGFTRRKGDVRTVVPGAAARLAFRSRG